ncbi:hypothetical protein [Streptomyces sp. NBC_00076]|uniref:hypothetical protein n=1 Tax=Streptomyces sp. NBC_00076 TaxID=2975642 RepID=UPI00324D97B3
MVGSGQAWRAGCRALSDILGETETETETETGTETETETETVLLGFDGPLTRLPPPGSSR